MIFKAKKPSRRKINCPASTNFSFFSIQPKIIEVIPKNNAHCEILVSPSNVFVNIIEKIMRYKSVNFSANKKQ